ncbi:class I SAM-dependent methyltransferase [Sphaerisporangium sp. TRM90804]|uniref:SAM-dependent methyltransferase n=1 Tax=Sphaerisporangium sp. TRM90804 TaxID=3031113 RepID=UPI002448CCD1|nr:class I SAM-dependent methyltransferase [Sphaerisporangium sp. TRM90804]MDH2425956.1 class I SAM-dependent methyltransferase [Sphaerisporangium sp. TRM90804]
MDRQTLSAIAHQDHPVAGPVDDANLDRLLRRAALAPGARILDLGCGEAEWSLRALGLVPASTADGVDISPEAVASAARAAAERGLSDRLTLHQTPADRFPAGEPYDLVMCVGSTHAFGGLTETLDAVAGRVRPGGLALVGEAFYERPPAPELAETLGEYADLAGTVATAEARGWLTVYGHVSEPAEWDEYEWSWTGTLARWAADNPGPDGDQALTMAMEHRDLWLNGYRGVLGFVTLLLRRG